MSLLTVPLSAPPRDMRVNKHVMWTWQDAFTDMSIWYVDAYKFERICGLQTFILATRMQKKWFIRRNLSVIDFYICQYNKVFPTALCGQHSARFTRRPHPRSHISVRKIMCRFLNGVLFVALRLPKSSLTLPPLTVTLTDTCFTSVDKLV